MNYFRILYLFHSWNNSSDIIKIIGNISDLIVDHLSWFSIVYAYQTRVLNKWTHIVCFNRFFIRHIFKITLWTQIPKRLDYYIHSIPFCLLIFTHLRNMRKIIFFCLHLYLYLFGIQDSLRTKRVRSVANIFTFSKHRKKIFM